MENLKKILIVDDNETNLYSLNKILSRLPVEIDTALSGFAAIDMARNHHYSLALVDIQMPEMDGFETMQRFRETPGHDLTPIILVSAIYTEDQYKIKGIETGAVDFIPKPVNPDILRGKVKVFLELEQNRLKLNALIEELQQKNQQLKEEIRQRKQIEKDLKIAKVAAEKTSEVKGRLLVNMSHEIRTPVNSILGFADLLTNPTISQDDKAKYLRYVSSSSHNLLFLLDEILEHSRLESGEMEIKTDQCNIVELCSEINESFNRIKNQSGKTEIKILFDQPSEGEPSFIITDSQRIRQVLSNLLNNSMKYTNEGSIHFGYHSDKEKIEFYVRDTGIGIAPEDIEGIFSRFKRAENQPGRTASGTGLGLAICKTIVEKMGGRIWVESEMNVGSVFKFSLPLNLGDSTAITQSQRKPYEEVPEPEWPDKTILIAEDEELNFLFLREALKPTRIKIHWAKNGHESIELIKDHSEIELVLMDIKMPDMDGYEATRAIKSIRPSVPVIIQTAFALSDEKAKSLKQGGDDFITKPINRQLLLKTLSRFLT
jgi:signal transduction histidine kinase